MGLIDGVNSQIVSVRNVEPNTTAYTDKKVDSVEKTDKTEQEKAVLDNVVAKSEDGDTLQEKKESVEALKDGLFFKKNAVEDKKDKEDAVIAEEKAENKYLEQQKENVTSLIGMTKSQVEQLYREGRITKKQYDDNMDSREEAIKEIQDNDVSGKMTQTIEQGQKTQDTIENIFKAAENDRADLAAQIF